MGRAIDLFVTYRFIKLLVTPFEKTDAFKLGIINKDGHRIIPPKPKVGAWDKTPKPLPLPKRRMLIRFFINSFLTSKNYLARCRALEPN